VSDKLLAWVMSVEAKGLEEVRKLPAITMNDRTANGADSARFGSVRVYRAIYVIAGTSATFVSVEEVHKHDY
jgi:hypothetical protein